MKTWMIVLTIYLLVFVIATGSGVYKLWSVNPGFTQVIALRSDPSEKPVPGPLRLSRIVPSAMTADTVKVTLIGSGLSRSTVVKLDEAIRAQTFIDANKVTISLDASDLAAEATNVVKVLDGQTEFGNGRIQIVRGQAGRWQISQDAQFLLLVLLMGAFGSCVYGLKTLADYIGEATFATSWSCYYLIQPFEGAGSALILYLAIRGGFLTGTGDNNSVNKFGICTIAALAGAFSDTAFMKLREVFLTLFRPQDNRSGKIDSKLQITTTSPPAWDSANKLYNETLKATGGAGGYKWSLAKPPAMPGGLNIDSSGKITGTQGSGVAGTFAITFSVTDGKDTATKDLTLTVT